MLTHPTKRTSIPHDMRKMGLQLEALIDSIIDSGKLKSDERVIWKWREGHWKATLKVEHPEQSGVELVIIMLPLLSRFSVQLNYQGTPARRFCSNSPHTMPHDCLEHPGERLFGYHKHRWSDQTGDECCYVPDDMSVISIEQAFYDFCSECGIIFDGVWSDPPPTQIGFETIA